MPPRCVWVCLLHRRAAVHQKVQAIDGNASQQAPIEPAESPMGPFDNCNRRAADNPRCGLQRKRHLIHCID